MGLAEQFLVLFSVRSVVFEAGDVVDLMPGSSDPFALASLAEVGVPLPDLLPEALAWAS
jgi:hypothetical protein